ncbi:hypothetical protein PUNSTDRAFT_142164 [Punctularia strigosozonata HHB-11173 SS5]|uniref:uncharacterized protein n=1 Tax=Punctularia strigosozonata (strain HHB-11173) TaxID=741275 RepID=UPI00044177A9|nr:uncharacterized protein PUNSTDRAFT_142164 [Punctularia strigosozonata HHB-11173 SS5]EIN11968.1 hypothetical protein PUNSTDRAFT_142164 [Punctularia strigosozonata HHB-11173 SS5]
MIVVSGYANNLQQWSSSDLAQQSSAMTNTSLLAIVKIVTVLWVQSSIAIAEASAPTIFPVGWSNVLASPGCITGTWTSPSRTFSWDQNSPTNCMWACQLQNHPVAAVTNGNACVCANFWSIDVDQVVSNSQCQTACSGDSTQTCGGFDTYQIFSGDFETIPFLTVSTTLQFNPAPSFHVSIPCAQNKPGGVTQLGDTVQLSNNSPSNCIDYCLNNIGSTYPIQIVAVDSGNDCQCGGLQVVGSQFISGYKGELPPPVAALADCSSSCPGSTGFCGGPSRVSVYGANWNPSYAPLAPVTWPWDLTVSCANIEITGEIFSDPVVAVSTLNTPAWCTAHCLSAGYKLAGVENGDECHCANSYSVLPSTDDPQECFDSFLPRCAGDNNLFCGGSGLRQVFALHGPAPASVLPTGWSVQSWCAVDNASRIFASPQEVTLANNSPGACVAHCASVGATLAGVEYGNECYCGTSYASGSKPVDASIWDCNMPCSDGGGQTCGGPWRIQVYGTA